MYLNYVGRCKKLCLWGTKPGDPSTNSVKKIGEDLLGAGMYLNENFNLVDSLPHPKENAEISFGCLQSVDDIKATYRPKGTKHNKGYVANITEPCDPENEVQLITKI